MHASYKLWHIELYRTVRYIILLIKQKYRFDNFGFPPESEMLEIIQLRFDFQVLHHVSILLYY